MTAPRPAGRGMSPEAEECIEQAAMFLAAQPGAVQRVLDTHRRRPDGRCTRCGYTVQWPCVTLVSARRAQKLLDTLTEPQVADESPSRSLP